MTPQLLIVLVTTLFFPAPVAPSPQAGSIAGSYAGRYECNQEWFDFTMTLAQPAGVKGLAEGLFPHQYVRMTMRSMDRAKRPIKFQGTFDAAQHAVSLRADDDLMLTSRGPNRRVTFQGTQNLSNGYLEGHLDYPGCDRFVLVPTASGRNPQFALQAYVSGLQREAFARERAAQQASAREARLRAGWVSPELRPIGGPVEFPAEMLEYYDDVQGKSADPFQGVRPLEVLFQELFDGSLKCLGTTTVSWTGTTGAAVAGMVINNRYVVECAGKCQGVKYRTRAGFHFGQSRPYPTINIKEVLYSPGQQINWEFSRPDAGSEPPRIRIHHWSPDLGSYGPGCKID